VKEFKNDENLQIINKTKNPTKGEKKVQDGRTPSLGKLGIFQRGQIARGMKKEIKYLNPPPQLQETY
jgi:hypothetical protein